MNPRTFPLAAAAFIAANLLPALPAADPITPFNGKNLIGWQTKAPGGRSQWVVGIPSLSAKNPKSLAADAGEGAMVNLVSGHGQSVDIYSEEKFGSCRIEVEVMVAEGANSGIYVHGEYEVQVLDSFGKTRLGSGDMGAVYGAAPPTVNACRKPGEWQKFVIDFVAPKFDADGKKVANARLKRVELNGTVLHEDLELKGPTPSGVTGKEAPEGPVMFQGDHGPVAYRNLKVTPAEG
ncbi:MAG TPA: DUF1080 domain-containing protein [Verrucomicrobiales bacterium]|nr:DUF1080 domain-containing protein [Verrucomicrobiales bacterium]